MEDGNGDYGYYDYSSASIEATGYANDAWAAGDTAGYGYWSTQANDASNSSVDVYVGGGDAVGYDSSYSYYDGY